VDIWGLERVIDANCAGKSEGNVVVKIRIDCDEVDDDDTIKASPAGFAAVTEVSIGLLEVARTEGSADIDADEATGVEVARKLGDLLAPKFMEGLEDAADKELDDEFRAKLAEYLAMENPEDAADCAEYETLTFAWMLALRLPALMMSAAYKTH